MEVVFEVAGRSVIVAAPAAIYDALPLTEVQRYRDERSMFTCKVALGLHGFDVIFVREPRTTVDERGPA